MTHISYAEIRKKAEEAARKKKLFERGQLINTLAEEEKSAPLMRLRMEVYKLFPKTPEGTRHAKEFFESLIHQK